MVCVSAVPAPVFVHATAVASALAKRLGAMPVRELPEPKKEGEVIPVVPFNVMLMSNPHDTSQREPDDTVTLMPLLIEIGPTVWAFLVAGMV